MGTSHGALGLLLGLLTSCAVDEGAPAPGDDPGQDDATEAVCTQGRFRCLAHVQQRSGRFGALATSPLGYGPAEIQAAYKIDPDAVVGTPTVGIVIAYGYLAIESDLAVYRRQFGLPACTIASGCLKVVNQQGQTSPLPPEPPPTDDWRTEQALDLDMVSAACPKCKILVVQADDNTGDGLLIGQNVAAQLGATVITNSWGGPEDPTPNPLEVARLEAFFNHPNVAIFAAAGDRGFNDMGDGPSYPATSAHVISVGGTRLVRDASARGWAESAWSLGGSACSLSIPKPAYQSASPCKFKATSDIAAVGDPSTGLAVYNATALKGPWLPVGGTSASSPIVAAIIAATGNGTADGTFFSTSTAKLFDVTSGTNGTCTPDTLLCNAAVGWDGPTGYGTPNAKALAPVAAPPPAQPPAPGPDNEDVSGGCATSGSGSGAGLVLGLALLGLRRRRRRRS
ncbi:MAG TPA: S53 family peptidase [Kofleriaceae bacterium]|nr:S53 family peptidase [Kofleriaceae bacterium]